MEFEGILEKARNREITEQEALFLFENAKDWIRVSQLLQTASYVRDKEVGRVFKLKVFALSSNKGCRTNPPCRYCGQSSRDSKQRFFTYPANPEEVAEAARIADEAGFMGVQLGGGCSGFKGAEAVEDAKIVKSVAPDLEIFVNYGADMSEENIIKLKELGVERIGCSFETINEELFRKIKPGDSLKERMRVAELIDKHGVGLVSVMMIGIGESYKDRVNHIFYLKRFKNLKRISVSGFLPIRGTPMENDPPATSIDIAKTIAITRLVHRNIDLSGSFGRDDQLQLWIMAGTNMRTIHGMFEPIHRVERVKFGGDVRKISDRFVFINSLPIYIKMIEEMGLKPGLRLNRRGDDKCA